MQAPELFTTAPSLAIPKAITNAGLQASAVDYYDIKEAFSVRVLALFESSSNARIEHMFMTRQPH